MKDNKDKIQELEHEIEQLRKTLNKVAEHLGEHENQIQVLRISEDMDKLIVEYMKRKHYIQ